MSGGEGSGELGPRDPWRVVGRTGPSRGALRDYALMLRRVIDALPLGVAVIDPRASVALWNDRFARLWGLSADAPVAREASVLVESIAPRIVNRESLEEVIAEATSGAETTDPVELELVDGDRLFATQVPLHAGTTRFAGMLCVCESLSPRREAVELWDPVTDLPEQPLLLDRLARAGPGRGGATGGIAVLFCDLDGLRRLAGRVDRGVADEIAREVAGRLRAEVRAGDTLARVGEAEFAVACEAIDGPRIVERIRARIAAALEPPIRVGTVSVGLEPIVGSAYTSVPEPDPAALIDEANADMYRSKLRRAGSLGGRAGGSYAGSA